MEAKGINGQVTVENGWIEIARKGLGRVGHSRGVKRIRRDQLVGVKFRPPGLMTNGFIAFEVAGRPFNGGLKEASRDDNAVTFKKKQLAAFEQLRETVEA